MRKGCTQSQKKKEKHINEGFFFTFKKCMKQFYLRLLGGVIFGFAFIFWGHCIMVYLWANAADGSQNNKEPECFALLHNFLMMHSAQFTLSSGCDVKSS